MKPLFLLDQSYKAHGVNFKRKATGAKSRQAFIYRFKYIDKNKFHCRKISPNIIRTRRNIIDVNIFRLVACLFDAINDRQREKNKERQSRKGERERRKQRRRRRQHSLEKRNNIYREKKTTSRN